MGGAGASDSFEFLLRTIKKDTGQIYLVINNQDDFPENDFVQDLQPNIDLPVKLLNSSTILLENHIYLTPANSGFKVVKHRIVADDDNSQIASHDVFMQSIAEQYPGKIMAVVLSGSDTAGVKGLKKIKDRNGVVLVQDPDEAVFKDLPLYCIETGITDQTLPLKDLVKLLSKPPQKSTMEVSSDHDPEDEMIILQILMLMKSWYDFDFTRLEPLQVKQTLQRRMRKSKIQDLKEFERVLQKGTKLSDLLYQDLFYRKPELFDNSIAFDHLEATILPEMLNNRENSDQVRCWILGSATGEDAYTLSILIKECLFKLGLSLDYRIFATDINEEFLKIARQGIFNREVVNKLSKSRIKNHFSRVEDKFRIGNDVRQPIIFSRQNILDDPPLTHLDFIVCPHFIIKFKKDAQRKILELFHFCLRKDGFLVRGTGESLLNSPYFKHLQNSIFHKTNRKSRPSIQQISPFKVESREPKQKVSVSFEQIHKNLLLEYNAASILISRDGDICYSSPKAGLYLNYHEGSIKKNLVTLIRKELLLHLKKALVTVHKKGEIVRSPAVKMKIDGQKKWISLCSMNAKDELEGHKLIVFEEERLIDTMVEEHNRSSQQELKAEILEKEQQLEFITRQDHKKQESLKAANLEIQNAMEELEINKQELQSINKELISLNVENLKKLNEFQEVSSDLQNVLNATDVALLFLTNDLRVLRFTPALSRISNMISTDKDRFLKELTISKIYPEFVDDVINVTNNLTTREREFKHEDGRWILVRLIPFRNIKGIVEGVAANFIDISNIKNTEEALKISNERFRLVAKATNDVIRDWDLQTNKVWWNSAINRQFGYAIDTFNSNLEWWIQNIHLDDREKVEQKLKQSIDGKEQNWQIEYRFKHVNGDYAFVLDRGYLIFDNQKNPVRMLSSMLDITERKQTENRLKTYTEAMPQIAFMADREGSVIYWNQRWFEYTGDKGATEGWGWKSTNILHADDLEPTVQRWLYSVRTGQDYEIEHRLKRHDGFHRWHLSRAVPVYDQSGTIEMWLGTTTDIHHYKKIQETLKENEANLREIMDNLSMATRAAKLGWGNWDLVNRVATWDERALEILGLKNSSGPMDDFYQLIHPEDQNKFQTILEECIAQQRQFDLEYRIVLPDQQIKYVHGSGEFVFADDGTPIKGSGLIRDITQRKLLQQQKDDFLAIASHEMKTPVAVMKGYVSLIKKLLVSKGITQEVALMEKLEDQIKRLTHLINDLLDATRLESGRMKFDEEIFDFDNLVREVVNSMQHISPHQLICNANSAQKVKLDRERTGQVIINFISNAIRYSPETKEILIDCRQDHNEVVVQVKDFGIGIPEEDQKKIFDRFYRVRPSGHKDSGLGLGLYISAEIVHRQKGSVFVESKENEGSVFGFRLPVVGNE